MLEVDGGEREEEEEREAEGAGAATAEEEEEEEATATTSRALLLLLLPPPPPFSSSAPAAAAAAAKGLRGPSSTPGASPSTAGTLSSREATRFEAPRALESSGKAIWTCEKPMAESMMAFEFFKEEGGWKSVRE